MHRALVALLNVRQEGERMLSAAHCQVASRGLSPDRIRGAPPWRHRNIKRSTIALSLSLQASALHRDRTRTKVWKKPIARRP
eukprot:2589919-Pyramimonas_sp.AAC.1